MRFQLHIIKQVAPNPQMHSLSRRDQDALELVRLPKRRRENGLKGLKACQRWFEPFHTMVALPILTGQDPIGG